MIKIMDSAALIAFLKDETGADIVESILRDAAAKCYVHAVNLCEVYYDLAREHGDLRARRSLDGLLIMGLAPRQDMDTSFWRQAGRYKATLARISLADCFCLTLANRIEGEIVTADHHEFDRVADKGLCKVTFIR